MVTPVHPMLVAYPIAFNAATLVGFVIYGVGGGLFWLKLTIAVNVVAVVLFLVRFFVYCRYWNGFVDAGVALGIVLSVIGVALTVAAGFQGWILIQDHHVGVQLISDQQRSERGT